MGAAFGTLSFEGTKAEVSKKFEEEQDDAAHRSGWEYSGDWNMASGLVFHDREFTDWREAEEYLQEHAEKWEEAVAVRVTKPPEPNKKMENLRERQRGLQTEVWNFGSAVAQRIREQKSEYKGCPSCGSRIATRYVRNEKCLVCGSEDFGYTKTDRERLSNIQDKIATLERQHKEEAARISGTEKVWLIGAWLAM